MSQKTMGRLSEDMKREVIAVLAEMKDPRLGTGLNTVTRVDVTPDLDVAKVYVSVLANPEGGVPVVKALNAASGHMRTEISRRMRIRKAPRFVFVLDDGAAYAEHINQVIQALHAGEGAGEADRA